MRALIKLFFMQGKVPKEIHAILREKLGEHASSYATIKTGFKRGDFFTCDAPHRGRPNTVTTPEIIDQIQELRTYQHPFCTSDFSRMVWLTNPFSGSSQSHL